MRLQDKVVLVTASTRGIGLATVQACAKEGAIVYMAARNLERASQRAEELNAMGYRVRTVYNDATDLESYRTMIEEVVKLEGRIDVLVNNFGTSDPKTDLDIEHTRWEDFQATVDINLASVFVSSQAVIPHMKKQGGGSIVNISSIGGLTPDIARIGYARQQGRDHLLIKKYRRADRPQQHPRQRSLPGPDRNRCRNEQHVQGIPGFLPAAYADPAHGQTGGNRGSRGLFRQR